MKRSAILITFTGLVCMILPMSAIVSATFAGGGQSGQMMPVVNQWNPPWFETWSNEMAKWQADIQPGWNTPSHIPDSDNFFPEPNKDPDLVDVQTVSRQGCGIGLAEYSPDTGASGGIFNFGAPPSSPDP